MRHVYIEGINGTNIIVQIRRQLDFDYVIGTNRAAAYIVDEENHLRYDVWLPANGIEGYLRVSFVRC